MLLRLLHRVQLLAAHDRAVEACDTEDIAALDLVPLQSTPFGCPFGGVSASKTRTSAPASLMLVAGRPVAHQCCTRLATDFLSLRSAGWRAATSAAGVGAGVGAGFAAAGFAAGFAATHVAQLPQLAGSAAHASTDSRQVSNHESQLLSGDENASSSIDRDFRSRHEWQNCAADSPKKTVRLATS